MKNRVVTAFVTTLFLSFYKVIRLSIQSILESYYILQVQGQFVLFDKGLPRE